MTEYKNEGAIIDLEQVFESNPAIYELRSYFRNRQEAISQLRELHPDDDAIRDFISNAFGIWGGHSREDGWSEHKGGKHPHLLVTDKDHILTHKLEGQKLVDAFRLVFNIPAGGQLKLF